MAKALFLDLDGTIRYSGDSIFINTPDQVRIFDCVELKLLEYRTQGYLLIGVTNQGGISAGFMTEENLQANLERTQELLGDARLDKIYVARTMDITDALRKPNAGMLLMARADHHLELSECLMVGDRPEDKGAADNAGVSFQWAWEFFGRYAPGAPSTQGAP